MTPADLKTLSDMEAKVTAIRSRLNLKKRCCGACDTALYENFGDWQTGIQLDGIISRLQKIQDNTEIDTEEKGHQ